MLAPLANLSWSCRHTSCVKKSFKQEAILFQVWIILPIRLDYAHHDNYYVYLMLMHLILIVYWKYYVHYFMYIGNTISIVCGTIYSLELMLFIPIKYQLYLNFDTIFFFLRQGRLFHCPRLVHFAARCRRAAPTRASPPSPPSSP